MKKRYIIVGLLASTLSVYGQGTKGYSKKRLRQTDVQALFSYYTQDNDHSAVTGGIGTENLQVYTSQLSLDWGNDSTRTYHIDSGVDVISSASTDNIDYVVSSASKTDARTHLNLGFGNHIRGTGSSYGVNGGASIESDYLSRSAGVSFDHVDPAQSREYSISFQAFFDDLRWGRLHNGKPQKLIYPAELRNKDWFTRHNRNSFNLSVGFYQTINARMALGIYPGITYQTGLLSTPFHRVYFRKEVDPTRPTKAVENLPDNRLKFPLGIQLNTFVSSRIVVRAHYSFYWDSFGIAAHTVDIETPVKVSYVVTFSPFVRIYNQSQANYFNPYMENDASNEFFTSDYDLSKFTSYKAGLGIRFTPVPQATKKAFSEIEVRYACYKRSDGMAAHFITTYFDLKYRKLR